MEFNANLLNGATPPRYVCDGKVDISNKYPDFELGYNHYHKYVNVYLEVYLYSHNQYYSKGGIEMPHSLAYINNHVRTASVLTDYHIAVWETLSNSGSP